MQGTFSAPESPFTIIGVGALHPFYKKIPQSGEGMTLYRSGSSYTFLLLMDDLSKKDIDNFRKQGMKFGLLPLRGGYVWLLDNGIGVFDMPYCPWLESQNDRSLSWSEDLGPLTRLLVEVHLLDGGRVTRAMKAVTVSPSFTKGLVTLHKAALADAEPSPASWAGAIAIYNSRFPAPADAMKKAVFTSMGGK